MGEVKLYYMMESAVKPMSDGAPCYTPLVNSKTDIHVVPLVMGSDYDALRAENAELVAALKRVVSVAFSGRESSAASMCNIASNALARRRGE